MKFSHPFRIFIALLLSPLLFAAYSRSEAQISGNSSLGVERRGHTATQLQNGKVLIVGGENTLGVVDQAELFDPNSQSFSNIGAATARTDHAATLLADGRVLLSGGRDGGGLLASTEIFNPADNSFIAGPVLNRARAGHSATMLADGRVLFAGGDALGSSELYDRAAQNFSFAGDLAEPRALHGAALLKDGTVLIAGGVDSGDNNAVLDSAEIFNPQTGRFAAAATAMGIARALPTLKVLPDGKVQVIGGSSDFS